MIHVGNGRKAYHGFHFFVVLRSFGAHHIEDGSAHRMSDVVELTVTRLRENIVDGGWHIVYSHFVPAENTSTR